MGIADRHYNQAPPPSGGLGAPAFRAWSMTTWIVIVCVAVFVVDRIAPSSMYLTTVSGLAIHKDVPIDEIDPDAIVKSEIQWTAETPDGRRIGKRYWALKSDPKPVPSAIAEETVVARPPIEALLYYSTAKLLSLEVWRLLGFQFLHGGFSHILLNVIGLVVFGPIVERQLGSKRYLAFYLVCGIAGALMYSLLGIGGWISQDVLGWGRLPGFLDASPNTPLIGASAGVFGVILAGAYLAPNVQILVMFLVPMPLRILAYGMVAISLFTLLTNGHNAGGEASHLGGALAGAFFIRNQKYLHDFFDVLGRADPTSHHYREGGRSAARGSASAAPKKPKRRRGVPSTEEVDRLLEKMHNEGGLAALSDKERETLRRASDDAA